MWKREISPARRTTTRRPARARQRRGRAPGRSAADDSYVIGQRLPCGDQRLTSLAPEANCPKSIASGPLVAY